MITKRIWRVFLTAVVCFLLVCSPAFAEESESVLNPDSEYTQTDIVTEDQSIPIHDSDHNLNNVDPVELEDSELTVIQIVEDEIDEITGDEVSFDDTSDVETSEITGSADEIPAIEITADETADNTYAAEEGDEAVCGINSDEETAESEFPDPEELLTEAGPDTQEETAVPEEAAGSSELTEETETGSEELQPEDTLTITGTTDSDDIFSELTEETEEQEDEADSSAVFEGAEQNPDELPEELSEETTETESAEVQEAALFAGEDELTISSNLYRGMTGDEVLAVQKRLEELGYLTVTPDGTFGAYTEAAVNEFQLANGLGYCDGIVGPWTIAKLNTDAVAKADAQNISYNTDDGSLTYYRTLAKGATGDDVLALQKRLAELGYLTAVPDGIFGSCTEAAVSEFQLANGLGYCDGMAGKWTYGKLNSNPVAKADAQSADTGDTLVYTRTLRMGMSGDDVLALQKRLAELGYLTVSPDGKYGTYTAAAVSEFQIANGLGYSDGIAGQWTYGKINDNPVSKEQADLMADVTFELTYARTLSMGCEGSDVLALQKRLAQLGYLSITPDSKYGTYTQAAVNAFQKASGREELTGTADKWTIDQLNSDTAVTAEIIEVNNSGAFTYTGNLTYDTESSAVLAVQKQLYKMGFLEAIPKGYYGNMTKAAVSAFQIACGLTTPTGIVDRWTVEMLNTHIFTEEEAAKYKEQLIYSDLASADYITDKNYNRGNYEIKYIVIHHMGGALTGEQCAAYFVNNGLENSANYCIGYDGDIAVSVPENYGAWTSSWWAADKQGITIEVSDESNSSYIIPEKAVKSLVYLCADLFTRNPSLGETMVYNVSDRDTVIDAKKANDPSALENVTGNVLVHNWTSGNTTSCPGEDMLSKLSKIAEKVNELLENPDAELDFSEFAVDKDDTDDDGTDDDNKE